MKYFIKDVDGAAKVKCLADGAKDPEDGWIEVEESDIPDGCIKIVGGKAVADPEAEAEAVDLRKKTKRNREMMRGDFIDALMAQANVDRMNKKEMCQPMDDALGAWTQIPKDDDE